MLGDFCVSDHPSAPLQAETTLMFQEAGSSSALAAGQLAANAQRAADLGALLRARKPRAVITIARGSSDHATTYGRYMIETQLGVLTSSLAPSIGSVYGANVDLTNTLCLAVSQSGRSPDLIKAVETAKAGGAMVLALVNAEGSPLEAIADFSLPLMAGPELSVAATKSFILTLTALAQLVAHWSNDAELLAAVTSLPALLGGAWQQDWSRAVTALHPARNLFVVGRGIGFGLAQEAALKFKETCGLHAEAFSSAEVQHGPMALVGQDFPVLALAQHDETHDGVIELAGRFAARGARLLLAGGEAVGAETLPTIPAHPAIEPILLIQSFYRMAAQLSVARGFDPDRPPHLNKVTRTL
jgi:glucosamine--fructose-6-phosphate aminotransferase (isomerizing)